MYSLRKLAGATRLGSYQARINLNIPWLIGHLVELHMHPNIVLGRGHLV